MKKTLMLLLLVLGFGFFNVNAQEPKDYIKAFFERYEQQGIDGSIDPLFLTNKWLDIDSESIVKLKKQLGDLCSQLGDYEGEELLTTRKLGKSIVYYSYIVKYARQPIRFNFTFYHSEGKWLLYSFKFDTELMNELSESSKILYLDLDGKEDSEN